MRPAKCASHAPSTRLKRQSGILPNLSAQFVARPDSYVEIWREKDALAGVILPVTEEYDVPLMVAAASLLRHSHMKRLLLGVTVHGIITCTTSAISTAPA
jgi:hypothetical protein